MRLLAAAFLIAVTLATHVSTQQRLASTLTPQIQSVLDTIKSADKGQLAIS